MTFAPTHKYADTLLMQEGVGGARKFRDKDGNYLPNNLQTKVVRHTPSEAEETEEAGPKLAYIHADAAMCILKACCFPQWENAVHTAQSPRGDDARVLNERGPNGEKVVRISERNPDGRNTYKVLVPKQIAFEIAED